jgi:hypothetical protein
MRPDLQPLRTVLCRSFAGFLDRVEPGLRQEHRLGQAAFLDPAAFEDWPAADRRRVGLIADLAAIPPGGRGITVLVQIEPRVGRAAALERRLLRYYLWLLARRRRPVRLIAIDLYGLHGLHGLQGGPPEVQPRAIVETWRGRERLHLPYRLLRLAGCPLEDWLGLTPK